MFQMSLRIKTYKGIEIQCMINWILSCTQFFFHEQYIMNNIIFKSCLVWSGRTIVYLTGILLVHFCFFPQMFTILNNSVMSFLMHVPLHNCTAVFLNKFLEVKLLIISGSTARNLIATAKLFKNAEPVYTSISNRGLQILNSH